MAEHPTYPTKAFVLYCEVAIRKEARAKRKEAIYQRVQSGIPPKQAAAEFGISIHRVRQIVDTMRRWERRQLQHPDVETVSDWLE